MKNIVKLTFLGDIMCKAQMIPAYAEMKSDESIEYDFSTIFKNISNLLQASDYVFANMETPISSDNTELTDAKFCFNSPHEFAEAARNAGIDFVATANNHCLDREIEGIHSTIQALDKAGLKHTGIFDTKNKKPCIVDVEGLRIGVLSYTYGTNAFSNHCYLPHSEYWRVNLFQNQEMSGKIGEWMFYHKNTFVGKVYHRILRMFGNNNGTKPIYERTEWSLLCRLHLLKDMKQLKKQKPDLIVMYMHTGGQYNPEATQETKKLTAFLLKNGINIVAGSHEHVVHGGDFSQIKDNKLATYSLGNFDGIAGVYEAPFDKMAEYSIAWHVYVDEESKRIQNTSFSVLKTVLESGSEQRIRTVPVYDLIQELSCKEQEKLVSDAKIIYKRFLGRDKANFEIEKEFNI